MEPETHGEEHPVEEPTRERSIEVDPRKLFSRDVSRFRLLDRDEEEALARQIVDARERVRDILRAEPHLCEVALADAGRGVVSPEEDFREQETVAILDRAQRAVEERRARELGVTLRRLRPFVRNLSAALDDYRTLRDRMVQANLRLVMVFARRHDRHPTLTFLDLVQEGTLGLIRAVEKYEPGRNVKFGSYAAQWIWQQIARAGDMHRSVIRTPIHWNQFQRRMSRERGHLAEDVDPSLPESRAVAQGMDPGRVEAMSRRFQFVSTDTPIGDEDDRTIGNLLADEDAEPEETMMQADLRNRLADVIGELHPRDAEILQRRFGLADDETETLDEIGARFGISRERVRQLEGRALRQLRELCQTRGLGEYLH